ncbi:MAG: class I SAM-dependent methyltransferase [Thermodesulfobacteriota bacterium]|nr:MAG: class I SAM-dependent methyltransferase [Thermodesulfobacteriota bacterium]
MEGIDSIVDEITVLGKDDKVFDKIELSFQEQAYERGKPHKYLMASLKLFNAIKGRVIVEIGCMRKEMLHGINEFNPECCNDGHSTVIWASSGAQVYSVDIDRKAVSIAKRSCKKYRNCTVKKADGIGFLEKFRDKIDLLYLDAWDVLPGTEYAENHVLAYLKAKPKLNRPNIIVIDDTDIASGGKGRLLLPVLAADGYRILVRGRQTVAIAG